MASHGCVTSIAALRSINREAAINACLVGGKNLGLGLFAGIWIGVRIWDRENAGEQLSLWPVLGMLTIAISQALIAICNIILLDTGYL
jgi:hypothetical protein